MSRPQGLSTVRVAVAELIATCISSDRYHCRSEGGHEMHCTECHEYYEAHERWAVESTPTSGPSLLDILQQHWPRGSK